MFEITLSAEINVPKEVVWEVIANTDDYPSWNRFVVVCESSLEVGAPIKMRVKVLPFIALSQRETIRENRPGEFLEYGIKIPMGILQSSRQHVLTPIDNNVTKYESKFVLSGVLAPLVKYLLGRQLTRGFADMTSGIVLRALDVYALKNI